MDWSSMEPEYNLAPKVDPAKESDAGFIANSWRRFHSFYRSFNGIVSAVTLLNMLSVLVFIGLFHHLVAVSPGRLGQLKPEQYLELDKEVQEFYDESYEDLDRRNISYDEQLFKAIRSIRHTIVIHHNEFKYTSEEYKLQAMGSSVNRAECKLQLSLLSEIAKKANREQQSVGANPPLSVVDFLESSARAESGALNGNFVWLGSYSSCERAKIFSSTIKSYLSDQQIQLGAAGWPTIKGRYCVAHLRAKSWPKFDIYFEDRITIRKGVCLPQPCHTAIYDQDEEIQLMVDYISRQNLPPPFNRDDRYETTDLYCLPDEDSAYRQFDNGAKLFFIFVACWALLTIWANVSYYRRAETMQKLRETIDIRMIINEKRDEDLLADSEHEDDADQGSSSNASETSAKKPAIVRSLGEPALVTGNNSDANATKAKKGTTKSKLNTNLLQAGARQLKKQFSSSAPSGDKMTRQQASTTGHLHSGLRSASDEGDDRSLTASIHSAQSSAGNTPLPSDLEESDVEYIKFFQSAGNQRQKKRLSKSVPKPSANFDYDESNKLQENADSFDLTRAFSIEANFKFLIRPRENVVANDDDSRYQAEPSARFGGGGRHGSPLARYSGPQQLAAVARRTSSPNDKLIKELQQSDSGVQIVSKSDPTNSDHRQQVQTTDQQQQLPTKTKNLRVNIDILDGLKVIATSYIIFGHTLMFFFGCSKDLRFADERMFDVTLVASINTLQVVGLFYLITGCLLTYLSFSRTKLKQLLSPAFWLLVMIGRYFRLLPAYLVVFWFARHVAPHLGYGRDWYDYRTDVEHPRGYCGQESWWVMWTMSAADVKIPMDCVPQAWYLSDDFRTLLVLPLYVYLLARNVFVGYAAIFATFAYSQMRMVTVLREANIDYKILLSWKPHVYAIMADRLHDVYTDFYVRMSTYLLGVIVGHVLYLYEIKRIKEIPKPLRTFGMKIAITAGLVVYFGARCIANPYVNQFLPAASDVSSDLVVLLIPFFKVSMEVCIAIMVLLLVTGGGHAVVREILSCSPMKILSNISYAVFLTHVEVMYKLEGLRFESSYWYLVMATTFFTVASHIVAFFLHLLYEMPMNNIIRHVFKKAFRTIN